MSARVPTIPDRETVARIKHLEAALRRFERVPPHGREAECADEGERDCRALLAELGAPGYERSSPPETIHIQSIDEFLDSIDEFLDGLDRE